MTRESAVLLRQPRRFLRPAVASSPAWCRMGGDDRFDRLDDLARELQEVSGVRLVDIEADEEEIVVTADVRDVRVQAWYDEDGDLCVDSDVEGFEDPDDVHEHLNEDDNTTPRWIWRGSWTRPNGSGLNTATPACPITETTCAGTPNQPID